MFSKLTLAAAMMAMVPFVTADFAEAARGDGVRNGDRQGQARKAKKRSNKNKAVVVTKKVNRNHNNSYKRKFNQIYAGLRNHRYWGGPRYRPHMKCVAVGKRRAGFGRKIPGIRGVGRGIGRKACRRALNKCRDKLDYRQATGRNPYARCVVTRRVVAHRY